MAINALLLALSLTSFSAVAAGLDEPETAQVTVTKMDPLLMGNTKAGPGTLTVDLLHREVNLILHRTKVCPPGRICSREIPQPLYIQLPLLSTETDDCGLFVIRAGEDLRAVNGTFEELVIQDARGYHCGGERPVVTTMIYRTERISRATGELVSTLSVLFGTALAPDSR